MLLLITAFLTMQWTATHIHLAEHHNHDGGHHQHSIEAHTHQLTGHHADAIDSAQHSDDSSIVEVDHKYCAAKVKKPDPSSTTVNTLTLQPAIHTTSVSAGLPIIFNTKLNYLDQSTVGLRAPPLHA